tara:strand:- start:624 stop:1139 length:516 start_codon:yes stop_codon:yes gene_type:complete
MKSRFFPRKRIFFISYLRRIGIAKFIVNFIFQRLFRINASIKTQVHFTSTFIGNNLFFDTKDLDSRVSFAVSGGLYIQSLNGVYFGKNVLLAPGVKIISANHSLDNSRKAEKASPIKIGDHVWLGANVVVLPGVEIGDGCVVAAGSVVTKSFLEKKIVIAGNPARKIKSLE